MNTTKQQTEGRYIALDLLCFISDIQTTLAPLQRMYEISMWGETTKQDLKTNIMAIFRSRIHLQSCLDTFGHRAIKSTKGCKNFGEVHQSIGLHVSELS